MEDGKVAIIISKTRIGLSPDSICHRGRTRSHRHEQWVEDGAPQAPQPTWSQYEISSWKRRSLCQRKEACAKRLVPKWDILCMQCARCAHEMCKMCDWDVQAGNEITHAREAGFSYWWLANYYSYISILQVGDVSYGLEFRCSRLLSQ